MKPEAAAAAHEPRKADPIHHLVIFEAGGRHLAFEADEVIEILQPAALAALPEASAHAAGALDVRGEVLTVFELRGLLGLPARPWTRRSRIVIVTGSHGKAGLIVDGVTEVAEATAHQIAPAPAMALGLDARMMSGMLRHDQAIVPILTVAEVLREVTEAGPDAAPPRPKKKG